MNWVLAAILICGASVFTACSSNEDSPVHDDSTLAECTIIFYGVEGLNLDADIHENLRQLYHGLRDNWPTTGCAVRRLASTQATTK